MYIEMDRSQNGLSRKGPFKGLVLTALPWAETVCSKLQLQSDNWRR